MYQIRAYQNYICNMIAKEKEIIESGDTVSLSIGGPEMLVEVVDLDNLAHCVWFSNENKLEKDSFHVDFLTLVKKAGKKD